MGGGGGEHKHHMIQEEQTHTRGWFRHERFLLTGFLVRGLFELIIIRVLGLGTPRWFPKLSA